MAVAVRQDLRDGAEMLGTVYAKLGELGQLPLGGWAVPRPWTFRGGKVTPNLNGRLLTALEPGYGVGYAVESRYLDAYSAVMTALREAALKAAAETLDRQVRA